jgi:putative flippase GtrA
VAFLASFAVNYTLQRVFSFNSRAPHGRSLALYVALVAFNTVAQVLIVELIASWGGGWQVGKIVATVCTTIWTYFAYRHIVFADRSPKSDSEVE